MSMERGLRGRQQASRVTMNQPATAKQTRRLWATDLPAPPIVPELAMGKLSAVKDTSHDLLSARVAAALADMDRQRLSRGRW
ncbi:hypothetical protein WJX72_002203 [[Myrmecia] bisecta]|uniref:Uncharacterized protein n=1 Tax=[Myrmecia] bisecta TaxID=41462 RepID=A0AAW1QPA6_9CHLO